MNSIQFANLTFRGLQKDILLRDDPDTKLIVTINSELVVAANRDPEFARIVNSSWATLDGQWTYWFARWRSGNPSIEKISGSDFIYDLCQVSAQRSWRVFLLGARPEVNKKAVKTLGARYTIDIDGYSPPQCDYPFPDELDMDIRTRLQAFSPHVLVMAFGAPKQEFWADSHRLFLQKLGTKIVIGAGGTLDFVSGDIPRAPRWMQRAGLESAWRFALQPRVRFRRILRAFKFLQYA